MNLLCVQTYTHRYMHTQTCSQRNGPICTHEQSYLQPFIRTNTATKVVPAYSHVNTQAHAVGCTQPHTVFDRSTEVPLTFHIALTEDNTNRAHRSYRTSPESSLYRGKPSSGNGRANAMSVVQSQRGQWLPANQHTLTVSLDTA